MATTQQPEPRRRLTDPPAKMSTYRLTVSNYDEASGLLLALLATLSVCVGIMLIAWLSGQFSVNTAAAEVEFLPPGDDEDPWGPSDDIEPPPPDEEVIEEEQVEVLNAVADAMAVRPAALERRISGTGTGRGGGGTGTGRKGGPALIVRFPKGLSVEEYARQLDFLGIELAVWDPDGLHYAYNLAKSRPDSRTGTPEAERKLKRLNLVASAADELEATDRELLRRAGINSSKRVMKFLPPRWAGVLYQLLQNAAGGRKVQSIRYLVVSDGSGGFTFEVVGQPTFR